MSSLPRGLTVLLAGAGLAGCWGAQSARSGAPAERAGNAIVISFEQIQGGGASLLRLVRHRVASMQVRETTGCPDVTLRGAKSIHSVSVPSVYVDGQRAANTCILEMLNTNDVQRVEVYPGGVTHRAGYHANGAGLILVFMRR
jgi:hypothetical protein